MISKITSKYQTTIPKEIRRLLKLNVSDKLEWKIINNKVYVSPTKNDFLKHKGKFHVKKGKTKEDIDKIRKIIAKKYA